MLATSLKRKLSKDSIEFVKGPSSKKSRVVKSANLSPGLSDVSTTSVRPRRDPKRSKRLGSPEPLTTSPPSSRPRPRPIANTTTIRTSLPNTPLSTQKGTADTPAAIIPQNSLTPNDSIIASRLPATPTPARSKPLSGRRKDASGSSQIVNNPRNAVSTPPKVASPKKTTETPIRTFLLPSRVRLGLPPPSSMPGSSDSLSPAANFNELASSQQDDGAEISSPRKRKENDIPKSAPSPSESPNKTPKKTKRTSGLDSPVIELFDSDEECSESQRISKKARTTLPATPASNFDQQSLGVINLCSEDEAVSKLSDKPTKNPLPSRKVLQRRATIATSNDTSFGTGPDTLSQSTSLTAGISRSKTLNSLPRQRSGSIEVGPVFVASGSSPDMAGPDPLPESAPGQHTSSDVEEPSFYATSPVQFPRHEDKEPSPFSYANSLRPQVHLDSDVQTPVAIPPSSPLPDPGTIVSQALGEGDDNDDFYVPSPVRGAGDREGSTHEPEAAHVSKAAENVKVLPLFFPESDQSQDETSSVNLPSVDSQVTLGDSQQDNDGQAQLSTVGGMASASSSMTIAQSTSTKTSNPSDDIEISCVRPATPQTERSVKIIPLPKAPARRVSAINTNVKHAAFLGPGTPTVYDPTSMPPLLTPRFFSQSYLPLRHPTTPLATSNVTPSSEVTSQGPPSVSEPRHLFSTIVFEEPEQQEPESEVAPMTGEEISIPALSRENIVQGPINEPSKEEGELTDPPTPDNNSSPPRIDLAKVLRKKKKKKNRVKGTDKVFPIVVPLARPPASDGPRRDVRKKRTLDKFDSVLATLQTMMVDQQGPVSSQAVASTLELAKLTGQLAHSQPLPVIQANSDGDTEIVADQAALEAATEHQHPGTLSYPDVTKLPSTSDRAQEAKASEHWGMATELIEPEVGPKEMASPDSEPASFQRSTSPRPAPTLSDPIPPSTPSSLDSTSRPPLERVLSHHNLNPVNTVPQQPQFHRRDQLQDNPTPPVLKFTTPLAHLSTGWSVSEHTIGRRLVRFDKDHDGHRLVISCERIKPGDWQAADTVISCIHREETGTYHVTSFDVLLLLEYLTNNHFPSGEKGRIRRNLESLRPITLFKNNPEDEQFFQRIMAFPDPKPRIMQQDLKVFGWDQLEQALDNVLSRYTIDISAMPAPDTSRPTQVSSATSTTSRSGTTDVPETPTGFLREEGSSTPVTNSAPLVHHSASKPFVRCHSPGEGLALQLKSHTVALVMHNGSFTEEMVQNDPYLAALVKESASCVQAIFPGQSPTAASDNELASDTDSPIIPDTSAEHTTPAYSAGHHRDSTSSHESPSPITPPSASTHELFFIHPTDTVNFDLNMFATPSVDIPGYEDSKTDDIIDDEDFLATHQLVYPDSLS